MDNGTELARLGEYGVVAAVLSGKVDAEDLVGAPMLWEPKDRRSFKDGLPTEEGDLKPSSL